MCREEAADLCAALAGAQLNVPVLAVVKEQELVARDIFRRLRDFMRL